jgi:hypothetical protein
MAEESAAPAAPAPAGVAAPAETATAPATQGSVARAIITTGISNREPVDELTTVGGDVPLVYLFTDLRGMQGERVTHRWEHDGQVVSEVGFDVKSQRWRVWSSKTIPTGTTGAWKVHVVNSAGEVLTTREFTCGTAQ